MAAAPTFKANPSNPTPQKPEQVEPLPPDPTLPHPQKDLRHVLDNILSHDLPPHEMRGQLLDFDNDTEDARRELMAHAKAIKANRPIKSYVDSAYRMADLILAML